MSQLPELLCNFAIEQHAYLVASLDEGLHVGAAAPGAGWTAGAPALRRLLAALHPGLSS